MGWSWCDNTLHTGRVWCAGPTHCDVTHKAPMVSQDSPALHFLPQQMSTTEKHFNDSCDSKTISPMVPTQEMPPNFFRGAHDYSGLNMGITPQPKRGQKFTLHYLLSVMMKTENPNVQHFVLCKRWHTTTTVWFLKRYLITWKYLWQMLNETIMP